MTIEQGLSIHSAPAEADAYDAAYWRRHAYILTTLAFAPLLLGIYYAAYWLRFEGQVSGAAWLAFSATAGWVVLVKLSWLLTLRVARGCLRSATFYDLLQLLKATVGALATVVLITYLLLAPTTIPRSIFLIDWGATVVLLGGLRTMVRGFRETAWPRFTRTDRIGVLIVGLSDMGESALRTLRRQRRSGYRVAGFVDTDPALVGTHVDGVPVLGTIAEVCALAQRHDVQQILVVQGCLSGAQWRTLMEEARRSFLELRVLPSFQQLISGSVSIQPRDVSIEDLLQRDPVCLNTAEIRQWIDHRVILVTGSAGSIGSEICRQLLQFSPQQLVLVDRSENGQFFLERELRRLNSSVQIDVCLADVLNKPRMQHIFETYRPQVIFHAAAYKHVPLMEDHPQEAVQNIVVATRQLADLAAEHHVQSFVMISTDKAVNPTSVMGTCKRIAELYVQSHPCQARCRFVTVRFGNVLDSAGSVVQLFRQQIAAGGPITVTSPKMVRFFMTIPEASQLVIQAGTIGKHGQILVLDMGNPVRIVDLAADMIRLSGLRVGIDIDIEYVGLRPGEKLYEELHASGERQLPTCHPKIILADHKPLEFERIAEAVDELQHLAVHNPGALLAQLQAIVPEYQGESAIRRRLQIAA